MNRRVLLMPFMAPVFLLGLLFLTASDLEEIAKQRKTKQETRHVFIVATRVTD